MNVQNYLQSRLLQVDILVLTCWDNHVNMRGMMTKDQLSELLRQVDAQALAAEVGVNIKTIYRLRRGENSPRLELVERLVAACRKLRGRK